MARKYWISEHRFDKSNRIFSYHTERDSPRAVLPSVVYQEKEGTALYSCPIFFYLGTII